MIPIVGETTTSIGILIITFYGNDDLQFCPLAFQHGS